MTTKLPQHVQTAVENICKAGCQRVNEIIAILDLDGDVTEARQLSRLERDQLLAELKHIMSIYDQK